jgi:hypothetical protein
MRIADPGERDLAAVAAALLDQGRRVDGLSRLVTATALLALMLLPALPQHSSRLLPVILAIVALLGLAETYLALRVGFDAALFARLASPIDGFDLDRLDGALPRLWPALRSQTGRPMAERIAGARRLLGRQGLLLMAQMALILVAAAIAALPGRSGG